MTAKKKATKKTGKALAKQVADGVGRFSGPIGGGVLAQVRPNVSLPDALKAFDAALEKVRDLRAILNAADEELKANRARCLSDAASALQVAAWTLRESAYAEADK